MTRIPVTVVEEVVVAVAVVVVVVVVVEAVVAVEEVVVVVAGSSLSQSRGPSTPLGVYEVVQCLSALSKSKHCLIGSSL